MSKHGLTDSIPSVYVTDPAGANRLLPLVHMQTVDSTNTACMDALRNPDADTWCALWTDDQTAGRGRQGRNWRSQPGASLCLSAGRRLAAGTHAHPSLTVALGAAVVQTLRKLGCPAQLKWPNDIVLGGAKLGGMLCEASSSGAGAATVLVAGVGINLRRFDTDMASSETPASSQSLQALPMAVLEDAGLTLSAADLAPHVAQAVVDVLSVASDASALALWCEQARQLDAWRGKHLVAHERGQQVCEGLAEGISADGQYVLQSADQRHTFALGELSLRPSGLATPASVHTGGALLVDIGNTRLKWCVADADGQRVGEPEHLSSRAYSDAHQCEALFRRMDECIANGVRAVRVARVGPSQWIALFEDFAQTRNLRFDVVLSSARCGPLTNAYANPAQLGVDRFLGALAVAHSFSGRAAVIVSAGTATTVDAVDADGTFRGGYILPGPQMMAQALHQNTAQLPQVGPQFALFPQTTEQAIASGIVQAQAGAVHGMLSALQQVCGKQPVLVLTGGARAWIKPVFEHAVEREYLVLEGLARWQAD